MDGGAHSGHSSRLDRDATRLMGGLFAAGALGFVMGPLGLYAGGVGPRADAVTFFVASILFTGGGLTQSWLAYPERRAHRPGRLAWRGAWIQSAGTVLFDYMTFEALSRTASSAHYATLVWAPNALGSVCFLLSGVLLYWSAPPVGWRPARRAAGWWEPPVNLLGCVLFGISAVASYATEGQLLDLATANWTTSLGAACFLAVGLAPLVLGMSFKVPRVSRLVALERTLQREAADVEQQLNSEMDQLECMGEHELARVERGLASDRLD